MISAALSCALPLAGELDAMRLTPSLVFFYFGSRLGNQRVLLIQSFRFRLLVFDRPQMFWGKRSSGPCLFSLQDYLEMSGDSKLPRDLKSTALLRCRRCRSVCLTSDRESLLLSASHLSVSGPRHAQSVSQLCQLVPCQLLPADLHYPPGTCVRCSEGELAVGRRVSDHRKAA